MERAKDKVAPVSKPVVKQANAMQAASASPSQLPGHTADRGGVPTSQVWSKYIDSRMKQFGTR